jgi:hypothetical protein
MDGLEGEGRWWRYLWCREPGRGREWIKKKWREKEGKRSDREGNKERKRMECKMVKKYYRHGEKCKLSATEWGKKEENVGDARE